VLIQGYDSYKLQNNNFLTFPTSFQLEPLNQAKTHEPVIIHLHPVALIIIRQKYGNWRLNINPDRKIFNISQDVEVCNVFLEILIILLIHPLCPESEYFEYLLRFLTVLMRFIKILMRQVILSYKPFSLKKY